MAIYSDVLLTPVGGVMTAWQNVWVRLVNNDSLVAYVSDAATPSGPTSTGRFVFSTKPPGGSYTVYTGPTNTGAWTATGETGRVIGYGEGDHIVGSDFTANPVSPYVPHASTGGASIGGDIVSKSLTLADNDYTTVRAGPGLIQVNGATDQILGGYSQFDGGINAHGAAGSIWKLGFGAGSGWINGSNGTRGDSIASSAPNATGATFFCHVYHNLITVPFADKGTASGWTYFLQIDPYSGGGDVYGELAGFAGVVTNNRLGAATVGVEVTAQNNLNRAGRLSAFTAGLQEMNAAITYYSRGYWATSYGNFQSGEAFFADGTSGWAYLLRLQGTASTDVFTVAGNGVVTAAQTINIAGTGGGYLLVLNSARDSSAHQVAWLAASGGNDATIGSNNDGSLATSGQFTSAGALISSKDRRVSKQSPAHAASPSPNATLGEIFAPAAMTGNVTVANPTAAAQGQVLYLIWTQDGTGGRTVTYSGTNFRSVGIAAQVTTLSTVTIDQAVCVDGTIWRVNRLVTGQTI